jgi:hypothetical protein
MRISVCDDSKYGTSFRSVGRPSRFQLFCSFIDNVILGSQSHFQLVEYKNASHLKRLIFFWFWSSGTTNQKYWSINHYSWGLFLDSRNTIWGTILIALICRVLPKQIRQLTVLIEKIASKNARCDLDPSARRIQKRIQFRSEMRLTVFSHLVPDIRVVPSRGHPKKWVFRCRFWIYWLRRTKKLLTTFSNFYVFGVKIEVKNRKLYTSIL